MKKVHVKKHERQEKGKTEGEVVLSSLLARIDKMEKELRELKKEVAKYGEDKKDKGPKPK